MFLWAVVGVVAELSVSNLYVTHGEGLPQWFCAWRTEVNTGDGAQCLGSSTVLGPLGFCSREERACRIA